MKLQNDLVIKSYKNNTSVKMNTWTTNSSNYQQSSTKGVSPRPAPYELEMQLHPVAKSFWAKTKTCITENVRSPAAMAKTVHR